MPLPCLHPAHRRALTPGLPPLRLIHPDNHGVFQIPSDACPSNYTAWKTDTYQELAPASLVSCTPRCCSPLGCKELPVAHPCDRRAAACRLASTCGGCRTRKETIG